MVCEICHEPNPCDTSSSDQQKPSSKQISMKPADDVESAPNRKDDMYVSWSELGGALAVAVTKSNGEIPPHSSISELIEYNYEAEEETEEVKPFGKHVPFPSPKNRARKIAAEDFLDSDDEFRRRMIRRTLRTGSSLLKFSQSITNEDIFENEGSSIIDESTESNNEGLKKNMDMMRSCSSCNLCPGSWECPRCTYINEPGGLDPCEYCKVCSEPNPDDTSSSDKRNLSKQASSKMNELMKSKDDLYTSWRELGGALGSDSNNFTRPVLSRHFSDRGSSGSESWVCTYCTYRNIDGVAVFCGVCGKAHC
mmetsp:Transcript_32648/g.53280  ORF Transcript_32648/g.53280 Transcript_32648/m.53280 type:complete len:309 (+) Transcript_32648:106-1032(+)